MDGGTFCKFIGYALWPLLTFVEEDTATRFKYLLTEVGHSITTTVIDISVIVVVFLKKNGQIWMSAILTMPMRSMMTCASVTIEVVDIVISVIRPLNGKYIDKDKDKQNLQIMILEL